MYESNVRPMISGLLAGLRMSLGLSIRIQAPHQGPKSPSRTPCPSAGPQQPYQVFTLPQWFFLFLVFMNLSRFSGKSLNFYGLVLIFMNPLGFLYIGHNFLEVDPWFLRFGLDYCGLIRVSRIGPNLYEFVWIYMHWLWFLWIPLNFHALIMVSTGFFRISMFSTICLHVSGLPRSFMV